MPWVKRAAEVRENVSWVSWKSLRSHDRTEEWTADFFSGSNKTPFLKES